MGTLILSLIGLMIALTYQAPITPPDAPLRTTLLFLGIFIAMSIVLAVFLRQAALRAFENIRDSHQGGPPILGSGDPARTLYNMLTYRNFVRMRRLYWAAVLVGFYILIHNFHLPYIIERPPFLGLGDGTHSKIIQALPFFTVFIIALALFCRVDNAFTAGRWKLRHYLVYHIRWMLVVAFPLTCLGFTFDAVRRYVFDFEAWAFRYPAVHVVANFAVFIVLFILFPLVPRILFRNRSLTRRPMRERLENLAARMEVKYRDLRVWVTGGGGATAFVAGPIRWTRYIFFADTLLDGLSGPEIEAVAAHEYAHARRNHLIVYMGLIFAFTACISPLETYDLYSALGISSGLATEINVTAQLAAMLVFLLTFSYLAKRFELEADILGAQAVGDFPLFIIMLERLAILNGVPTTAWSPMHFSIATRMERLTMFHMFPGEIEKYLSRIRKARTVIVLFIVLGIITLISGGYRDLTRSPAEIAIRDYSYAIHKQDYVRAFRHLERWAPYVNQEDAAEEADKLSGKLLRAGWLEEGLLALKRAGEFDTEKKALYQEKLEQLKRLIAPRN
ncbi:MAG: hypothetical protein E3J72_14535 [Planctomycetota bacterium]|nr:MAG: hypothetical protein E3J72_14535 [Planctomycetota bacterium]